MALEGGQEWHDAFNSKKAREIVAAETQKSHAESKTTGEFIRHFEKMNPGALKSLKSSLEDAAHRKSVHKSYLETLLSFDKTLETGERIGTAVLGYLVGSIGNPAAGVALAFAGGVTTPLMIKDYLRDAKQKHQLFVERATSLISILDAEIKKRDVTTSGIEA